MSRISTYREFWPHYLREHRRPACRALHYVGTLFTFIVPVLALTLTHWFWLALPVLGYGPAWIGHFFIEKNKPATFGYPLWAFISDYRMFALAISGRLGPELAAAVAAAPAAPPELPRAA